MENTILTLDSWTTIEGYYWGGREREIITTVKVHRLTKTRAAVKMPNDREYRLINVDKKGLLPYFQIIDDSSGQAYGDYSYIKVRLATSAEIFRVKALQKTKSIDFNKCTTEELSTILEILNLSVD